MRYRKEDKNGDYSFGRGEGDFFINTPEAVGMAVISRLQLRKGEWFLDTIAGTDWTQILGKYTSGLYDIVIRERILGTPNVTEIVKYQSQRDVDTRDLLITATLNTAFGQTSVTTYV
ncbi:hypothetical protein ACLHG3_001944 [Serratia marcescens]|uniref:hypothetical protein n=1 Tax=Serratia marcescens TaxID=615 RepID=UPI0039E2CFBE